MNKDHELKNNISPPRQALFLGACFGFHLGDPNFVLALAYAVTNKTPFLAGK